MNAIKAGEDITEAVYAAGLLDRSPGCNHGDVGLNVEVKGGDLTGRLSIVGGAGFTVLVRALPYKHCHYFSKVGTTSPVFQVRGEPPGARPTAFGQCINNPALPFITLGKTLPLPNTVYVFKELVSSPLAGRSCGIFQQLLTKNPGSVCGYNGEQDYMSKACDASGFNTSDCRHNLKCQSVALESIQQLTLLRGSQQLSRNKLVGLYEEVVWGDRQQAYNMVGWLYSTIPEGFIYPDFEVFIQNKVPSIVSALKSGVQLPTAFQYKYWLGGDKEIFLQKAADIIWAALDVNGVKIQFDWNLEGKRDAYYDFYNHTLTLAMPRFPVLDDFIKNRDLTIENIIHESFHLYQNSLITDQGQCSMKTTDQRYAQTHVFSINKSALVSATDPSGQPRHKIYCGSPIELTARRFTRAVFSGWLGKKPGIHLCDKYIM